jgi:hypothetical protein
MNFNEKLDAIFEKKGVPLNPKDKGYFDSCVKKNENKDNPEAYCAAIKDRAWKSDMWRGKDKTKKQTLKDVSKDLKECEMIKGGLADGKDLSDIAKKHGVTENDIQKELKMGLKVEKEHTDDPKKQREIALDHLYEDPKYYSKLAKIENKK